MENVAIFAEIGEEVDEHNPIFLSESEIANNDMEVKTELNEFVSGTEADNHNCNEESLNLEEKEESKIPGLFAPFNHGMKPDFEYIRLELERSVSNQEAATKIINDRYKLITENAAKHKMKEEKDKMTFTQLSHSVDIEDIIKTTELLCNLHITSTSPSKDQLEVSDSYLENIYWNDNLYEFINLNDIEIDTKAKISNVDMQNSVTDHLEYGVEDFISHERNEQMDGEKSFTFTQMSQELDTAKFMKNIESAFEKLEDDDSSCEDECIEFHCGINKGRGFFTAT
ncbi:hypothetical protein HNY73_019543 [Argiope bruennichi]|uniref:Uncharacterized protein n=1 Tax=Argiope bruennichi TaxID=94029 RepID=A0A8T0E5E7_ARGBR|nr:hypothetical protein HNY73_019543 [Argiope bruennichi]